MLTDAQQRKAELRALLRDRARQACASDRAIASQAVCSLLTTRSEWKNASSILAYAPMSREVDIWPAVLEAFAQGKQVVLPAYSPASDSYQTLQVADPDRDLRSGVLGIREPDPLRCPEISIKMLDLVLVPGLGFTPSGCRLGRGKGYYDRMLAQARGFKCGVAFDWQLLPDIPMEGHDVHLDCILTPGRWAPVLLPPRL